jgi:hypothetical protein
LGFDSPKKTVRVGYHSDRTVATDSAIELKY